MVEDVRLQQQSEEFIDDNNVTIEKRCFMLCCGKDDTDERNFFRLNISLNVFEDDPSKRKKVEVEGKVNCMVLEISPKVVKSMAQLIPEFSIMQRLGSLGPMKPKMPR